MEFTPWLITLATVIAVFYLDRWENRYIKSLFDWVPAILLAYVLPALVTALGNWDFSTHSIHQYSRDYFIPLAIIAVMSSLSFKQLRAIGWKPILVFVAGSLWIALFPVVYIFLYQDGDWVQDLLVGEAYWKGIPPVVGSWIGGSTSQLVLKELVACPEHIFLAVLVLDTLLVNIWTILMFQGIKKSNFLNAILRIDNKIEPALVERTSAKVLSPFWCFGILLTGVFLINVLVDQFIMQIILLSVVGLLLSNFIRSWNFHFVLKAGGLLIILVMAVLGLKLSFSLFRIETPFLLFLICWLCSHFVFMLGIAKIINLNMAWVPIASMANVGGIATAPAVTAAYNKTWMPHAVILAILSMATGTFWGMLTIFLLNNFVF